MRKRRPRPDRRLERLRARRALGRKLTGREIIYFYSDAQMVICQDRLYHGFLLMRRRVYEAGGNPNTQTLCRFCGPKDFAEFYTQDETAKPTNRRYQGICKACSAADVLRRKPWQQEEG